MSLFLYFWIAFGLSFIGSLPIGLITLNIVQRSIQKGKPAGMMMALGATVMECIYPYVALLSLDTLVENVVFDQSIQIVGTLVFFGMGVYYLRKESRPPLPVAQYDRRDFFRGVVVATMNVLVVPFWIFLALWLEANGIALKGQAVLVVFSLGAGLGALLAFGAYVWLSGWIMQRLVLINRYLDRVIGGIFLLLGLIQLLQLFF
ncbi:MAG: LysE family transporter [Bacteroidota bacterium]